jgi:hypothetical protein
MMRVRGAGWIAVAALVMGMGTSSCGGGTDTADTTVVPDVVMDTLDVPAGDDGTSDTSVRPDVIPVDDVTDDADAVDTTTPPACTEGDPCDDGNPCTVGDICVDAVCKGTVVAACDDTFDCTADACSTATECTHVVKPGWCLVGESCYEDGEVDPANACMGCVSALAGDHFLADDTLPCTDGNGCTMGDRCLGGICKPGAMSCDDGEECTSDACIDGECVNTALTGTACSDGNACTTGDHCQSGDCATVATDCSDDNECTLDSCSPATGCSHEPIEKACDDGNVCTVGDACVQGVCTSGDQRLACDDLNPCTDDGCVPDRVGGCVHIPNVAPCNDNDPCTVGDTCRKAGCEAGKDALPCDDLNPCTTDHCEPGVGCVFVNNTEGCDDADPCTLNDTCGGGECQHGTGALSCEDEDPCTDDVCAAGEGCTHPFNTATCDDNNVCTQDDVCHGDGVCKGTVPADWCDDGMQCTTDTCHPLNGCQHKVENRPECRPQVVIDYPPRGATLDPLSAKLGTTKTVTVVGHITSGLDGWMIPSLMINGQPVLANPVDNSFTFDIDSHQGFNPIVVDAEDIQGLKDHVVQSYYFSSQWYPVDDTNPAQSMVNDGLMMFLGPKVWDDSDRTGTPNSIADIIVLYLKTMDLMSFITNPMATGSQVGCNYKINVNSITFNTNNIGVSIAPVEGGLSLVAQLNNIVVKFHADMSGTFCVLGDFDGTATVDWLKIAASLGLSVDANGQAVVTPGTSSVTMGTLNVDTSNWLINLIMPLLKSTLQDSLVSAFQDQIDQIVPTLQDALSSLALNTDFDIPAFIPGGAATSLGLRSTLSTILCHTTGCTVGLKATIVTTHGVQHAVLGSIGRAGCLTGVVEPVPSYPVGSQTPTPPALEIGLHDDFFNQIPYALFWAGALTLPVPASMLGSVDLSSYGITDMNLSIDLMLPPILSTCNDQNALRLQIGDLGVVVDMKLFGTPVQMQMFASLEAAARLEAVDTPTGKQISIAVDSPSFIDIEIASLSGGLVGAEDTLGNLIRTTLIPQLLASLTGESLGTFPIPSLDLSGMIEGLPAGTAISIEIREILRANAYNVLSGNVK